MQLYNITTNKQLAIIPKADAVAAGLKETSDMEAWIRTQSSIFDRKNILWISRQERTSGDERADLLGVCEDELVLVELKRGSVEKEAIVQGLSYLARHTKSDRPDLMSLFVKQAGVTGAWALLDAPLSEDEAESRFIAHTPEDQPLNQYRSVVLVGTDFDPDTLQVCNLLNESLGLQGVLTLECWRMQLFQHGNQYLCAFDKLLPSKDVEDEIAQRREERRTGKYKRCPLRVAWMAEFKATAAARNFAFSSKRGESYQCRMEIPGGGRITIGIGVDRPWLAVTSNHSTVNYSKFATEFTGVVQNSDQDHHAVGFDPIDWANPVERGILTEKMLRAVDTLLSPQATV